MKSIKNCFKGKASIQIPACECVCVCVLCFACDYAPKHSSRFHIKIIPRKYQKASSFGLVSQYPAPDTSIDNFVSCYSKNKTQKGKKAKNKKRNGNLLLYYLGVSLHWRSANNTYRRWTIERDWGCKMPCKCSWSMVGNWVEIIWCMYVLII